MTIEFLAPSADKTVLEGEGAFTPRFDEAGLVTAVVTDARDGAVLMLAHMNSEALALTLQTRIAHYYSRSRGKIWKKGETSGNLQKVVEVLTDCDQDAVLLKVSVAGHDASCHTGRRSCFYRAVRIDDGAPLLEVVDEQRHFDPHAVYGEGAH
ncbi:phosphoribosyl-AMP cyclohydrolase [Rhizobium sp. RU35A]|uniref:phosphoribosyl-AMP cyclohydrolase n=1 Tax=Rhizobium sp. RU35A TaxID=1907414 RepID=UPI00095596A9|nr:phosphoribosyl-AMP cyclohydrolase [Rhizobium sp. RU35A]SIQ76499.1 phosphoribosyl-AMP cyclohydrolase [Rhizobium sp. RU35A]